MKTFKKYLSIYLNIFKMSFMSEMTHKGNFLTWIAVHSISLLTLIIFFKLVYTNVAQINGWSQYQSLLVLGTGTLITGLGSLTFFPFMYGFSREIQKGEFDFKLAKPLNILFQSAFRWVDIEDLIGKTIKIIEDNQLYLYDSGLTPNVGIDQKSDSQIVNLGNVDNFRIQLNRHTIYEKNRIDYIIVKKGDTFEEDEGVVLWPIEKLSDLINKCDDAYFLSALTRLNLNQKIL